MMLTRAWSPNSRSMAWANENSAEVKSVRSMIEELNTVSVGSRYQPGFPMLVPQQFTDPELPVETDPPMPDELGGPCSHAVPEVVATVKPPWPDSKSSERRMTALDFVGDRPRARMATKAEERCKLFMGVTSNLLPLRATTHQVAFAAQDLRMQN